MSENVLDLKQDLKRQSFNKYMQVNRNAYLKIILYITSSLATTLLNKYILTKTQFEYPFLLIIYQSILICMLVLILDLLNVCSINFYKFRKWMIPSIFLSIMIFTGTKSLQYITMSFYTLLKNTGIILISLIEWIFYNRKISFVEVLSYLLMIISSCSTEMIVNYTGMLWLLSNIISTAVYVISLRHIVHFDKGSVYESIFFPNFTAIFVTSVLFFYTEFPVKNEITVKTSPFIALSGISAFVTALSSGTILDILSSTTYSMMGALNKVLIGFSGFVALQEPVTPQKIYSLLIGIGATCLYTHCMYKKSK